MNKYLVEVYVPTIGKSYDVFIPEQIQIYDLVKVISKGIEKIASEIYIAGENAILCDYISGEVLDVNKSVEELGLINGSQLMLI